jgi:hypothetical protein
VIDVLGFDQCLEIIFEDLGEIILEFGPTEIFEDFLPFWRVLGNRDQVTTQSRASLITTNLILTKIWLQGSGEYLQRRALADAIRPH